MQPTEDSFLLYHHLGLGDHINLNGLVRKLYADISFDRFYLMTKEQYTDQVAFMFRDLPNLFCVRAPDDSWQSPTRFVAHAIFEEFPGNKLKHFMGTENGGFYVPPDPSILPEMYFYTSLEYSPEDKYKYFYLERDYNREQIVYDDIVNYDEYVFVADDPSRNYVIDVDRVYGRNSYPVIRSCDYVNYTFFDLLTVAERAVGCHVMWSSFDKLCDLLNPGFTQLYMHESYINDGNGKIGLKNFPKSTILAYENYCADRGIILL